MQVLERMARAEGDRPHFELLTQRVWHLGQYPHDLGGAVPDKQERNPGAFDSYVKAEAARWAPILKATSPAAK